MRVFTFLLVGVFLLAGCTNRSTLPIQTSYDSQALSALVDSIYKAGNLETQIGNWKDENQIFHLIFAYNKLGQHQREEGLFEPAIQTHLLGLELAKEVKDTLQIILAYNQIGTCYRRLGRLDIASENHFQALQLSHLCSDTTYQIKKARVASYNGLGNIHMTLKDYVSAGQEFHMALNGEKSLNNWLGMAINYANLGSLHESVERKDSARVYYQLALEANIKAKSIMGQSLCHNHLGRLHEQEGDFDGALAEYSIAYDLMKDSSDKYHAIEPCISISNLYLSQGMQEKAQPYLDKCLMNAYSINSYELISKAHKLLASYFELQHLPQMALAALKKSQIYQDSAAIMANKEVVQNVQVAYERDKASREMSIYQKALEDESFFKKLAIGIGAVVSLLLLLLMGAISYAYHERLKGLKLRSKMDHMRNLFFINVTHEFRTPLTVILGLTEQLEKKKNRPEEQQHMLKTINRQGSSLLKLVNQLLDVSKMAFKQEEQSWSHGDVAEYIRLLTDDYADYATMQGVSIQLKAAPSEIDFVQGYFDVIFRNLLSNSMKYSQKGGVIEVFCGIENDRFIMKVKDYGSGVPEQDLPYIFEMFTQSSNNVDAGSGVGLSYTRQLVENMNGEIKGENLAGKGFMVTLSLPTCQNVETTPWSPFMGISTFHDEVSVEKQEPESDDNSLKPLILIVEDNTDVAFFIGNVLQDTYRIQFARDGKKGLDMALELMPDLILTDLMMPEMDGYELCGAIQKSPILNHIPVVILTALSDHKDKLKGLELGADAFLSKPFHADELTLRIEKLLEKRMLLRKKYAEVSASTDINIAIEFPVADKQFIDTLKSLVEKNLDNAELNVQLLADEFHMSRSQFARKCKSIMGLTPLQYVQNSRLERAKQLLRTENLSVGDVAFRCGFEDVSYFTRVFKQATGKTPTQFKA